MMSRRFCWAMLVAVGTVLGCALMDYGRTDAAPPPAPDAAADDQTAEIADQLKEIKTQVKEINALLHSGTLTVVVAINPNARH
jgi:hypothetical protein